VSWWIKSAWLAAVLFIGCVMVYVFPDYFGRVVMAVCVFAIFTRRAWIFTR
jgi:hypothetical protein